MPDSKKPKSKTTTDDVNDELDSPGQDADVAGGTVPAVEMITMTFRGENFLFPKDRDEWPTTAIVALSELKLGQGVREILGPVQWTTLNRILPRYKDFQEVFVPAFAEAQKACVNG